MRAYLDSLYARYEQSHIRLSGQPFPIVDATGNAVGHIDIVELRNGSLRVAGWVRARKVRLVLAGLQAEAEPNLRRADVAAAFGGGEAVGFDLSLPADRRVLGATAAPGLSFEAEGDAPEIDPLSLPVAMPRSAVWRVRLGFLRDGILAAPAALGWLLTRNPAHRARVKRRLRLAVLPPSVLLDSRLFQPAAPAPAPMQSQQLTIVLPVYNAFELLQECLDRLARHTDLPCRLIVIEDCSTDVRVRPFLRGWAADRNWVELLENPENLGFIGATNRGLAKAMAVGAGPIVLLNSDALVPEGWASRIARPFQTDASVASVTPMSNDAEIMSAPILCQRINLNPGQGDAIDAVARRISPDLPLEAVPTGVGFCMALSREWLRRAGPLDTTFGRGYGEEVDWCQRVARRGGRHLALPGLFVEHRGGESFGQEEKRARIADSARIIRRRYPDFDLSVQSFIARDPLRSPRLALGLAWAGSLDPSWPVPVYLAHSMGGGAELYLADRIEADLEAGRPSVILRVGGKQRWRIELATPFGRSHGDSDDTNLIRGLVACLPRRHLVYSCGVGDPDAVELPGILLSMLADTDSAEMLFHDYLPLSPSYTLLDGDGIYRGPVRPDATDPAHATCRPDGSTVRIVDWQDAWKAFASRAGITVFSRDSARQVAAVWPELQSRITLRPHRLRQPVATLPAPAVGQPAVIGVLGNIGLQKGARVLRDMARLLAACPGGPGLVLIGNIDPAFALSAPARVHGSYRLADLPALVERHGITHWLIPSVGPETFCYSLHEALATGLPVMAFDLGAQGDAVRAAPNGIEIPFGDGNNLAARVMAAFEGVKTAPFTRAEVLPGDGKTFHIAGTVADKE